MDRLPPPVYRIRVVLHAPLRFAYRWCTDYKRDDGKRAGESFVRNVLERRPGEIILQDLWTEDGRWILNNNRTTLFPPDRWHVDSFGSTRLLSLDYTLRELPGGRTQLDIRARRRPIGMDPVRVSRRTYEANLTQLWRAFGKSLDRDYRKHRARAHRR